MSEPTFREFVFSDFEWYRPGVQATWMQVLLRCPFHTGLLATILLRAQQRVYSRGHARLAYLVRTLCVFLFSADFVPGMTIGKSLYMPHPMGVVIGGGLTIGERVTILQGVTAGTRHADGTVEPEFATIGDGAIIAAHAVLVGGVRIGDHAQVGANSVVISDVEARAVVFGVPARRVGTRDPQSA